MNVGGTLNSITANMTQNFSKPMENDYRMTTIQEKQIEDASLTKKEIPNPYEEKGVPNFVWQIFTKVTEKTDLYSQKNVEYRLFNDTNENTNWKEQVSQLQETMSKPVSPDQLNSLVEEKNMILEQFNQSRMSPSEEKQFRDLIQSRQKSQANILDGMMAALTTVSYTPLEVAA